MENFFDLLQLKTELFLTKRKKRRAIKKEKQKKKNPILDWIQALLEAAFWVLIINQFLFQAYQIPSGSMEKTLLIKDRIFVNKLIYGPELLPGTAKLSGFVEPVRGDVITFENPSYISKGSLFDLIQRILYMLTFTLINIDNDELGNPRVHFLIKRAAGVGGDRLRFVKGELLIKPPGFSNWVNEEQLLKLSKKQDHTRRLINDEVYRYIRTQAFEDAYQQTGVQVNQSVQISQQSRQYAQADLYAWSYWRNEALYSLYPQDKRYGSNWWKGELGWYLPEGWIFPLGDNRDNSRDGRYFGPVKVKKVLGKGSFRYWPPSRIGIIE